MSFMPVYVCVWAAWLVSCRAIAIIAFILQVIGVVMAIILLIWVLCEAMRCCDDEAGWCDRCIIYLTPIFWILAGTFMITKVAFCIPEHTSVVVDPYTRLRLIAIVSCIMLQSSANYGNVGRARYRSIKREPRGYRTRLKMMGNTYTCLQILICYTTSWLNTTIILIILRESLFNLFLKRIPVLLQQL